MTRLPEDVPLDLVVESQDSMASRTSSAWPGPRARCSSRRWCRPVYAGADPDGSVARLGRYWREELEAAIA